MKSSPINVVLMALLIGGFLLYSMRFLMVFRFGILIFLGLFLIGVLAYITIPKVKDAWYKFKNRHKPLGRIAHQKDRCTTQIEQLRQSQADIKASIKELKQQAYGSKKQAEIDQLLHGFQDELAIRAQKIAFYKSCIQRLTQMEQQILINEQLTQKRAQLRQLQEHNYEDLGDLEAMKTRLQLDEQHVDLLEQLSRKMEKTKSLNDTAALRQELEQRLKL